MAPICRGSCPISAGASRRGGGFHSFGMGYHVVFAAGGEFAAAGQSGVGADGYDGGLRDGDGVAGAPAVTAADVG